MPNVAQIQQTIINAQYKMAALVNANLALINTGGLAINENLINYLSLNTYGLVYQNNQLDYISTTTQIIYDRLQGIIGIPPNTSFDPNYRSNNIVINVAGNPLPPPQIVSIVAGVTPTPLSVSYSTAMYGFAKYALIRPDDTFDWNTEVQPFLGGFTITGQDNGSGKFLDSFTFYILP